VTKENENQIDHDAMFKELLHQLIEPFLRLCFLEAASCLDFSSFLDTIKNSDRSSQQCELGRNNPVGWALPTKSGFA